MAQPQPPPQQQQQHYPHPPRSYSPPQNMQTPGASQQQFSQPPNKRQKLSPSHPNPPSQPLNGHPHAPPQPQNGHPQPIQHSSPTPYAPSPYTMSPSGSTHASPHFATVQLPPNAYSNNAPLAPSPSPSYSTPYGNGNTPTISLPPHRQQNYQTSPFPSPQGHANPNQPHQQPLQPSNYNSYPMNPQPPQHPGTMGPPLKPADKARDDIDPMDVLGGTGVNLQEEEQFMFQINNSSFNSQLSGSQGTVSSGHSFTQFPPGNEASFYGAGPANAVAEQPNTKSHEEYAKKMAERAWDASAYDLAMARAREIQEQFVAGGKMHAKMAQTAEKHGLALKWDERKMGPGESKSMGEFKPPQTFPREIRTHTMTGANVTMTAIGGTFLPIDTALIDQAALLSIALKHRLRGLIEDSIKLSRGRQTGSHGIVPEEWKDVAVEAGGSSSTIVAEGATVRAGWESAVSPHSDPLKRPFSSISDVTPSSHLDGKKKSASKLQIPNEVVSSLRSAATKERDIEEARLKKRQSRAAGDGAARQGSVAPGAPGLSAPDPEKAPTKKELKKKQESKASEAATHAAANVTTAQFLGGGNNMFGRKKKYSWMTGSTTPGSGASTPGRLTTSGLPATPGGPIQAPVPERLTSDSARRLGQWREDQPRGSRVQLRDWVAVLEEDGRAKKSLQKAYIALDSSDPK